jgi:hypothetical protein
MTVLARSLEIVFHEMGTPVSSDALYQAFSPLWSPLATVSEDDIAVDDYGFCSHNGVIFAKRNVDRFDRRAITTPKHLPLALAP